VNRVRKALIVGLGSIGRRHLANLERLAPGLDVRIWRHRPEGEGGSKNVYSQEDALAFGAEVALICSPSPEHLRAARLLAAAGTHLFIEKPIADRLDGVDELIAACRERGLTLMVGYNLRFHTPVALLKREIDSGSIGRVLYVRTEVGQYLPDWRPGADYRASVSAQAALGGGVLLELSHEIDLARWLGGPVAAVQAQTAVVAGLEIDVEDMAELVFEFRSGALGSVHLDMVQRSMTRGCRVAGTEGTITWDGVSDRVAMFHQSTGQWRDLHPPQNTDRNAMYLAELDHFLSCVSADEKPAVTGEDGREALQIALSAREANQTGKRVLL
jgi:predicted dehydrogenase